ncbi:hypothetical protein [Nocardia vulneris]|uniref:Uncharacterized protein n=1 Tax=Nocardia vulneris TaxID=1141657 RepID=A0ABR4ZCZ7_9NOCA|nr:hypothetical protein [Nocardia vulneris]KIA63014.1 hypothetical protein FG87_21860 [Nocardia vulneris]
MSGKPDAITARFLRGECSWDDVAADKRGYLEIERGWGSRSPLLMRVVEGIMRGGSSSSV